MASQLLLRMTVSNLVYIYCVCGCGCVWVCERPWRDPSSLSVGVACVYYNHVVENSKFRVEVIHIYEQSKRFSFLTYYFELQ